MNISKAASQLGRRGGRTRSRAQTLARRRNGKKGGRPRKGRIEKSTGGWLVELEPGWQFYDSRFEKTRLLPTARKARAAVRYAIPWPEDPDLNK